MCGRFMVDDAGELIDLNTCKFIEYGDEVCRLLNELDSENKELRQALIRCAFEER